jgi:carboxymethylenebutenolidase
MLPARRCSATVGRDPPDRRNTWRSIVADTVNPQQNTTFASNGGRAHGYLALPPSGSGPGLIVIQEWWGLTSHIASLTDRFAATGFVALAPDLYGGTTTHDAAEAGRLMQELPVDRAARDLSGAVEFLLRHDDVTGDALGVVGFCMGGAFALALASQQGERIAAAVAFYAVGDIPEMSSLTAAVQAHHGLEDAFFPVEAAHELAARIEKESGRAPEFHYYPAGHAFLNNENLLGTYDPEQAAIAWDRAVAFLHQHLGRGDRGA